MIDIEDSFNDSDGMTNALGHIVAINQRNTQIAAQRDHAAAIRMQTTALEIQNRLEEDRAKIELKRLEIEQQRFWAEEAERDLRREEMEQVKQLRALLVDSLVALEWLKNRRPVNSVSGDTSMDDKLLRSVASLQANLKMLESQSGVLSDLADMKELRHYKTRLADYLEDRVTSGELLVDPYSDILLRLEAVSEFFRIANAEITRLIAWRNDWKSCVPKVTEQELQEAEVEFREIINKLPETQEGLRRMLNSNDWSQGPDGADLHEALLLCAEISGIPLPGMAASEKTKMSQNTMECAFDTAATRDDFYQFAHGSGKLVDAVRNNFDSALARIKDLSLDHREHSKQVEIATQCVADHAFLRAGKILNALEKQFRDIPYQKVAADLSRLLEVRERVEEIELSMSGEYEREKWEQLANEVESLEQFLSKPSSELGRVCGPKIVRIKAKMASKQKFNEIKKGIISVMTILWAAALGFISLYLIFG